MAFQSRQTLGESRVGRAVRWLGRGPERLLEAERAQLPLWSPVALGTGILVWFALPSRMDWMVFICLCLAGATLLLLLGKGHRRLSRTVGMAFLLAAAGCVLVWGKAVLVGDTVLARPAMVSMDASVERVEALSGRGLVRILARPVDRPDLPGRIRVNVALADAPRGVPLRPGDRIRLRARLMPPAAAAFPGGYDYARRVWFEGIGATGRALPPIVVTYRTPGTGPGMRDRLSNHVAGRVDGAAGALAVTLATGDRGRIPPEVEEAMRQSGLAHLLSISGVHVTALIGGIVFLVYSLLALSTRLALRLPLLLIAATAGASAGIGYTLLTGSEVPTIRSCVSALLVMAGLALGREAISLRLLACGALFCMIFWPEAVVGPSFQLSFTAVAAIVTLHEYPPFRRLVQARDEAPWMRLMRFLGGLFATGILVELVLLPIALYHFHRNGLLGSVANMVAIPLTEIVIMPAEGLALVMDGVGAGAPAWWVVEQALNFLLWIAHAIARQSAATALTPAIPPIVFAVAMMGLFWCMLWRTRLRWLGLPVLALGLSAYVLAPVPDILVSADGHHVALRTAGGELALLRERTGGYMRDQLVEQAAFGGNPITLGDMPGARCSSDFCTADMQGRDRRYRVLMARTRLSVPWADLIRHCAAADIVIADRRLPRACQARWLTLDKRELARRGGAAISLANGHVSRSRDPRDEHPWIRATIRSHFSKHGSSSTGARPMQPPSNH